MQRCKSPGRSDPRARTERRCLILAPVSFPRTSPFPVNNFVDTSPLTLTPCQAGQTGSAVPAGFTRSVLENVKREPRQGRTLFRTMTSNNIDDKSTLAREFERSLCHRVLTICMAKVNFVSIGMKKLRYELQAAFRCSYGRRRSKHLRCKLSLSIYSFRGTKHDLILYVVPTALLSASLSMYICL